MLHYTYIVIITIREGKSAVRTKIAYNSWGANEMFNTLSSQYSNVEIIYSEQPKQNNCSRIILK